VIKCVTFVKDPEEVSELLKKILRGLFTIIVIILGYNISKPLTS